MEPPILAMVSQPLVHDPGLDDREPVRVIDLQDLLHPGQPDHHPAADRDAPAREARPGPASEERHFQFVTNAHDADDLVCGRWEDDNVRLVLFDREAVAFVDQEVTPRTEHPGRADDGRKAMEEW